MAATMIVAQAVDLNGNVLSGAKLYVFDAGTSTPRTVYTTSSLTTPATNPEIATAAAGATVWVDDTAGNIKVELTDSAGATTYFSQDDIDPTQGNVLVYPLGGSRTPITLDDGPVVVADHSELRAYTADQLTAGLSFWVRGRASAGDGAAGHYYWSNADNTALVTADEVTSGQGDGGRVIAPTFDKTGASGAFLLNPAPYVQPISHYGATDAGVQAAGSGAAAYIDMEGNSVTSTDTVANTTTPYFNGEIIAENASGNTSIVKPQSYLPDYALQRPRTKFALMDLQDEDILWLGTSIPIEGSGSGNSYPSLVADAMGARVNNQAWAGSHASFDGSISSPAINDVKCLSMTAADQAVLAAAYSGTFWNDTDPVTKASEMTCTHRIYNQFLTTPYSLVVLDHNHNDRRLAPGTLDPESTSISAVSVGSTTTFTVADAGTIAVGDGVAVRVTGITRLDYAAGRVSAVSGNDITVQITSTGYTGTFSSGTLYKLDRNTLYGSFEFLLYFIRWCANDQGLTAPTIVLCGAPSEFTNNAADDSIFSNARRIKAIADKWELPFFDIAYYLDVKLQDHLYYFPDNVHPTTLVARQAVTNHWVNWLSGGVSKPVVESDFLPRGGAEAFDEARPAYYTKFKSGFAPLDWVVGAESSVVSEDWSGGLTGWTTTGTAPTVVTAPWDAGESALKPSVASGSTGYAYKTSLTTDEGFTLQFDLWLDEVAGLTTETTARTVTIARVQSAAGIYYTIDLLISAARTKLRLGIWTSAPAVSYFDDVQKSLSADTQHTIKLESVRAQTGKWDGAVLLTLDGEEYVIAQATQDTTQSNPTRLDLGCTFSNLAAAADVYIGNVELSGTPIYDFRSRFTGTFTNGDADTVTVVNGVITDVS